MFNGVNFEYELIGRQTALPPIVFISGYAIARDFWYPLTGKLSEERQILLFENQGFDATLDNGSPLTLDTMAENIINLIICLGILKPVIVGFAMGAGLAQKIAITHPDIVKHLILLGAVMNFNELAKATCEKFCRFREIGDLTAYAKLLYDTIFSTSFKTILSVDDFSKAFIPTVGAGQTILNQKRQLEVLKTFDSRSWAANITVPTTVIAFGEDYFAPPGESRLLKDTIGKNADFIMLKDAAHAALATHAEIIQGIIREKCT
jgi:3-oxoadipate enol-lactonase